MQGGEGVYSSKQVGIRYGAGRCSSTHVGIFDGLDGPHSSSWAEGFALGVGTLDAGRGMGDVGLLRL